MGMDGCILLFKVMNRCKVVLLNMRWDTLCYYLSSIRVRPLLDGGDEWGGGPSVVNLLGSSVWKFLLMWTRLVFAIVRLSHIPYWRIRRWGYFLVSWVDKLDGIMWRCVCQLTDRYLYSCPGTVALWLSLQACMWVPYSCSHDK